MKKRFWLLIAATHIVVAIVVFLLAPALYSRLASHTHDPAVVDSSGDVAYWTCPMHPSVRADEPGSCPICGMDLTPVRPEAAEPSELDADAEEMTFHVDPFRQQLINVQSAPVEERVMEKEIRTVAVLELDETGVSEVYPRVAGWVREVFVNFMHQHVHVGQPLFSVYSPELVASQEEYLLAQQTLEKLGGSPFEHVSTGTESILRAARRRLERFDLTADQIQTLSRTGEVQTAVVVHSPASGHVIEREVFPNRYVTPETRVYTIADHARMWAAVQIYEQDIGQVRLGQPAVMRLISYPGESFQGRVRFIEPHLDGETRTLKVRLEFPNPNFRLKPEMYGDVELKISLGRFLAVPDGAVLRTGRRDVVFVDRGEGRMEMRTVEIGEKAEGYYRVLSGLQAGERVVTQANFLIDSESKIRGIAADWDTPLPTHAH